MGEEGGEEELLGTTVHRRLLTMHLLHHTIIIITITTITIIIIIIIIVILIIIILIIILIPASQRSEGATGGPTCASLSLLTFSALESCSSAWPPITSRASPRASSISGSPATTLPTHVTA